MSRLFEQARERARGKLKTKKVEVEEWGVTLWVKELTPKKKGTLSRLQVNDEGTGAAESSWPFRSRILHLSTYEDEACTIQFIKSTQEGGDAELSEIGDEWGCKGFDQVVDAAMEINGTSKKIAIPGNSQRTTRILKKTRR